MQLSKTDSCFVCGGHNPMGIKASFQTDHDLLCAFSRVTLEEHFQGWGRIAHGGVLAALLDETCIYAAMGLGGQAVTAELQVRYRKPVPCGCEITLFGEVLSHRRRIVRVRARLVVSGDICAEAEARLFIDRSSSQSPGT